MADRVAYIRTSDRSSFRRCRRKWAFSSSLRDNLDAIDRPSYFWLGTGGHFALEDYHGYNYYGSPVEAFNAYVEANHRWCKKSKRNMPHDWEEQVEMGQGVLEHYLVWLTNRDPLKTYWHPNAKGELEPQVEIKILLELPWEEGRYGWDKVYYQGTLDRVVEVDGELFVLDWKFYKQFSQSHLDWDGQMSAYVWLGSTIYERAMSGAILVQFRKALPDLPRILQGGTISTAKNQSTTHGHYRRALIDMYGTVNKAPDQNVEYLNTLAAQETGDRDNYILRQRTYRTEAQQQAEGSKILMELEDMLNPDLPLYPNPTRDCSWDCQQQDVCLMMDRDDDWEPLLADTTVSRDEDNENWREYLPQ